MDNNYVMHFGIKGMRWGVRRYQNKDGTLTPAGKVRYSDVVIKNNQNVNISNSYKNHDVILSKGVHVYRVSDSDENAYKKTRIYVTPSKTDNDMYKFLSGTEKSSNFDYTFNKDVKIASEKSVADAILKLAHNDTTRAKLYQSILAGRSFVTFYGKRKIKDALSYENTEIPKNVNKIIKTSVGKIRYGTTDSYTQFNSLLFKELKNKGYSGMVDSIDLRSGSEAPIVIFDTGSMVLQSKKKVEI